MGIEPHRLSSILELVGDEGFELSLSGSEPLVLTITLIPNVSGR